MNYVKVWAHGFAQQEGRTKGREYLVSWWCSSPGKVASGEVGQQRRSQGHRGCRGRTPCRRWLRGCWTPGGARPSAVSSPGCGAASGWRRSPAGETSPGGGPKGRAGKGNFLVQLTSLSASPTSHLRVQHTSIAYRRALFSS